MKTTLRTALAAIALIAATVPTMAQDAATKAEMGTIRKAYERAMQIEKQGKSDAKPNHQTFESVTTAHYGTTKYTVDFVFDNSEFVEEIQCNPCVLVLAREKTDSDVKEYLYNEDGELIFFFMRTKADEQGKYGEYRYYYDKRGPFWKIDRVFDAKTGKLDSEVSEALTPEVAGTETWYMRPASDLKQAFQSLNAIYD